MITVTINTISAPSTTEGYTITHTISLPAIDKEDAYDLIQLLVQDQKEDHPNDFLLMEHSTPELDALIPPCDIFFVYQLKTEKNYTVYSINL